MPLGHMPSIDLDNGTIINVDRKAFALIVIYMRNEFARNPFAQLSPDWEKASDLIEKLWSELK